MAGFQVIVSLLLLAALSVAADDEEKGPLSWEPVTRGEDPPDNAIIGGFRRVAGKDQPDYVGRVWRASAIIPGGVSKYDGKHYASATLRGTSYVNLDTYEVAVDHSSRIRWVPAALGAVPTGAVPSGVTADGQPLYVCRVMDTDLSVHKDQFMLRVGVLDTESKKCHMDFHGPQAFPTYEVLVSDD
ncbi:hypothetical protein FOCC_FOCC013788 [Frankliniella occidentalis]|uniref:Uncharacterized protein LOC113217399 n=1 Tax=Frankliniella occidentalis TaxID=133901 RepID=A0A6J1TK02_FRAOC|nr:uncharacterized protein LOC113217399 [Frankliniella occidentalis]KAE8740696.1 hypothetical protein FOCC_FOCC013788 [Frankliniella occidentalis]